MLHTRFDPISGNTEVLLEVPNSDTDSIASDLTGPGRAVDKFYCSAGRKLERVINVVATKMGKGPLSAAQRIRLRRAEIISVTMDHSDSERRYSPCECWHCRFGREFRSSRKRTTNRSPKELGTLSKKIEKDCKRLIRYIECVQLFLCILFLTPHRKSEEFSTQWQAMESLHDFILFDRDLRDVLEICGVKNAISKLERKYAVFRYGYAKEDLLLSKSRHALVLLEEASLQVFLADFLEMHRQGITSGIDWDRISEYLL